MATKKAGLDSETLLIPALFSTISSLSIINLLYKYTTEIKVDIGNINISNDGIIKIASLIKVKKPIPLFIIKVTNLSDWVNHTITVKVKLLTQIGKIRFLIIYNEYCFT